MYIEFRQRLPNGASGMAAGYTKQAINLALRTICQTHNIIIVNQVTQPYRYRVEFKQPSDYTLFALVWVIKNYNFEYTVWNEPIDTAYDGLRYAKSLSTP